MNKQSLKFWVCFIFLAAVVVCARAQDILGNLAGTALDSTGSVVPGAQVKARNVATNLEVSAATNEKGEYHFYGLPVGTYRVSFSKTGFETEIHTQILVQGNRTTTLDGKLSPGKVSETIVVSGTPLLNQVDTTNGYVLGEMVIQSTPLGTGSFTQLAILSPGVNADLLNTTGTNAGLGNQSIWANGQRDTSNSFSFNGVSANNIFNGKSSSQVSGNRILLNTGESSVTNPNGDIQTSTSVYAATGQALPTPPPETIQELRVNTSMYDASQGANSGAHISILTKSGGNQFHGGAYEYHQTDAWDATPYFFHGTGVGFAKPPLHRNVFGGLIGGPIMKDKLFFFASYQGQRVTDQENGISYVAVPLGLTKDRSDAGLIAAANSFLDPSGMCGAAGHPACFAGTIDPVARKILNATAPDGSFLVPSSSSDFMNLESNHFASTAIVGQPSRFRADQANGNIDYVFGAKDRFAGKYYFQRDPNVTPFSESMLLGFPQTLHAGSQVLSLSNTTILTPNLSWDQHFGFLRMSAFANTDQSLKPSDVGMSTFGTSLFPTINIRYGDSNNFMTSPVDPNGSFFFNPLTIGPVDNFAHAGFYQNTFEGTSNLNWVHGRHTISTGITWDYLQLNIINKNNQSATLNFENFTTFLQGQVCGPSNGCPGQGASFFLNGASSRYYRAHQAGAYVQDSYKILPNLTLSLGVRWDWDGPLTEKNGNLSNFYPANYSYNPVSDTFSNIGLVVAGNNKLFPTKGVSDSTLTGRQWGFGPRIGVVWSPSALKNFVVRAGFGMYYDRGEFFSEFSPGAGGDISGPFGVTVAPPFVVQIFTPPAMPPTGAGTFSNPFGTGTPPAPPNSLAGVQSLIPNAAQLAANTTTFCTNNGIGGGACGPFFFGGYDPRNQLPYSENWNLDLQWQPFNSVLVNVAYIGNHGVHEVIPIPFNQAQIATPQNPTLKGGALQQNYSYAWNVPGVASESQSTLVAGFGQGNIDLRVPYTGFEANSDFNKAEGISHYNALQIGVTKRMSHGLMITGSYTWSHTLDEQSALGLFYNGNNPLNPRSAYGNSDFDRTHVFSISYQYVFPTISNGSNFKKQVVNGWGIGGITVLESGQPYSVTDFSGSTGSIYWGTQDFITNPIVPIGGLGSQPVSPFLQGTTGVNASRPVLNALAFGPPPGLAPCPASPAPCATGVPPCDPMTGVCDNLETGYSTTTGRNIFRGPFQSRFDFGVFKDFKINERVHLRYDAQAFNIFNHPSFDTPNNNVRFAPGFPNPPAYSKLSNSTCGSTNIPDTSMGAPMGATLGAYICPPSGQLGVIQHTIGSPRVIQMALHLTF